MTMKPYTHVDILPFNKQVQTRPNARKVSDRFEIVKRWVLIDSLTDTELAEVNSTIDDAILMASSIAHNHSILGDES